MTTLERIPKKSWMIAALVFGAGVLNYFDRQTLSILKTTLRTELGLTDTQYSYLVAAFMAPYIVMYVVSGRIVDRYGSRGPMTVFIALWSLATAAAGLVQNLFQLALARAWLGAAEPGAFPAGMRAQLTWFPASRRGFLMSLISPCTAVGAVLAPPVVAALTLGWGWRAVFIVPGVLGLLLAIAWWCVDTSPVRVEKPTVAETGRPGILANRRFRGLLLARVITDPVWYFYLFWIPGYLQEKAGFTLTKLGIVGWIPSAVAAVVAVMSARILDSKTAGVLDPSVIRVRFLIGVSLLAPAALFIPGSTSTFSLISLLCVVYTIANLWFLHSAVILADIFPPERIASAMGVMGAVGASVALLMNLGVGAVVETVGYGPLFFVTAFLHPLGAFLQAGFFRATRP